jgi:hypothetical protein
MIFKTKYQRRKPIFFTRITPEMNQEQIVKAIINALAKSGITVKQDTDLDVDEERTGE